MKQINRIRKIPYCNKTEFVKVEIVNSVTTKIIISGGIFRPIAIRRSRSLIQLGTGQTNAFQWETWQLHGSLTISTLYILTIKNGPLRTKRTEIHFVLEKPDVLFDSNARPYVD